MKLTIELSEKQLETISKSLDLYSRILCGQLNEVSRVIQYADFTRPVLSTSEEHRQAEGLINMLQQLLFPEIYPAQYSICNKAKLPSTAAVAYDIYQVIDKLKRGRDVFKTSSEEDLPIIEEEH